VNAHGVTPNLELTPAQRKRDLSGSPQRQEQGSAGAYSSQLDCSAQLNRSFAISAMSKAPNPHIFRSRLEFGR
jgi:hypothetical protein